MVNEAPYFNYNVMVSNKNNPDKQVSVGVFDFFGFGGNHGGHAGHYGTEDIDDSLGNLDYYITDDLSESGFTNIDEVLVTIKPQPYTTGVTINQTTINLIEIDAIDVVTIP